MYDDELHWPAYMVETRTFCCCLMSVSLALQKESSTNSNVLGTHTPVCDLPLSFPSDSGREVSWLCEADKILSDLISPMEDGSVVSLLWDRSSSSTCSSCPKLSGRLGRALWSSLSCLRFVRAVTAGWRDGRLLWLWVCEGVQIPRLIIFLQQEVDRARTW